MNRFNTRRQTERVGIAPTLPVMVRMERGIALEETLNQFKGDIGKNYGNNGRNTFSMALSITS